jgi:hypothetical protein
MATDTTFGNPIFLDRLLSVRIITQSASQLTASNCDKFTQDWVHAYQVPTLYAQHGCGIQISHKI